MTGARAAHGHARGAGLVHVHGRLSVEVGHYVNPASSLSNAPLDAARRHALGVPYGLWRETLVNPPDGGVGLLAPRGLAGIVAGRVVAVVGAAHHEHRAGRVMHET